MRTITINDVGRVFVDKSGDAYSVLHGGPDIFPCIPTNESGVCYYSHLGQRLEYIKDNSFIGYAGGKESQRFDRWMDETREQAIERAKRELYNRAKFIIDAMRERLSNPSYNMLTDEDKEFVFSESIKSIKDNT